MTYEANIQVPIEAVPILERANNNPIEYAVLFYPEIHSYRMSYGQVAKMLGVNKIDLIEYLGELGFEYVSISEDDLLKDIESVTERAR